MFHAEDSLVRFAVTIGNTHGQLTAMLPSGIRRRSNPQTKESLVRIDNIWRQDRKIKLMFRQRPCVCCDLRKNWRCCAYVRNMRICSESYVLETNIVTIDNGEDHLLVRQGATRQLGTLSFDGAYIMSLGTGPLRRIREQTHHSGVHWGLISIYLLTGIGFTHGGSSTVHIYTQTIHRTTQWNRIPRTELT